MALFEKKCPLEDATTLIDGASTQNRGEWEKCAIKDSSADTRTIISGGAKLIDQVQDDSWNLIVDDLSMNNQLGDTCLKTEVTKKPISSFALQSLEPLFHYFKMVCESQESFPGFRPCCGRRRTPFLSKRLTARLKVRSAETKDNHVMYTPSFSASSSLCTDSDRGHVDKFKVPTISVQNQDSCYYTLAKVAIDRGECMILGDLPSKTIHRREETNDLSLSLEKFRFTFIHMKQPMDLLLFSKKHKRNQENNPSKRILHIQALKMVQFILGAIFFLTQMNLVISSTVNKISTSQMMRLHQTADIINNQNKRKLQQHALTDTSIKIAVKAWLTNATNATLKYGPITYWDTSKVTTMESLFDRDLNNEAPSNTHHISSTFLVSHVDTSPLNDEAFRNISPIDVTLEVSHVDTFPLKLLAL